MALWLLKLKLRWQLFWGTNIKFQEAKGMERYLTIGSGLKIKKGDMEVSMESLLHMDTTLDQNEMAEEGKQQRESVEKTVAAMHTVIDRIPEVASEVLDLIREDKMKVMKEVAATLGNLSRPSATGEKTEKN
jgi:hypothetical protein